MCALVAVTLSGGLTRFQGLAKRSVQRFRNGSSQLRSRRATAAGLIPASMAIPASTATASSGTWPTGLSRFPGGSVPSPRVEELISRIPKDDFGHVEMVELVWSAVRLGSERESGIKVALEQLRAEWLRGKYDTQNNRRDFYVALTGAITKGGRVLCRTPRPQRHCSTRLVRRLNRLAHGTASPPLSAKFRKPSRRQPQASSPEHRHLLWRLSSRARREIFDTAAKAEVTQLCPRDHRQVESVPAVGVNA